VKTFTCKTLSHKAQNSLTANHHNQTNLYIQSVDTTAVMSTDWIYCIWTITGCLPTGYNQTNQITNQDCLIIQLHIGIDVTEVLQVGKLNVQWSPPYVLKLGCTMQYILSYVIHPIKYFPSIYWTSSFVLFISWAHSTFILLFTIT
jgi:hypothetical protein